MSLKSLITSLSLALLADATYAAAPAAPPERIVIIHAGTLLDVPGKAPRGKSTLLVRDGKIEQVRDGFVAPGSFKNLATDTQVIDLRDYYVLPGLIDSHVHLTSDKAGIEGQLAGVTNSIADNAYEAAENARKTLKAGFTTVRNLGDGDGVTLSLRNAIASGKFPGPRILDAGRAISATSGHTDPRLGFREDLWEALASDAICDGADDCRRAVRTQVARGVDVIKMATTGGVNSRLNVGLGQQMFADEVRAVVETAHMYGKKVAVHAHGADGIRLALEAGADSIEHGTLLDAPTLEIFARSKAWYVPTLSTVNGYIERLRLNPDAYTGEVRKKIEWRIGITGKSLALAVKAGIPIAFGTDAGVSLHGRNADEFELMVKHGMSPAQAITAATVNASQLLGLADSIGTLEAGKQADLIAVDADPLNDVSVLKNVRWVIKGGQVFKDPGAAP